MTPRIRLILACVGIYLMGLASGTLLLSSGPSNLELFFSRTIDAQKMSSAVIAKFDTKFSLTPDEHKKIEPILREMCETLYKTRSQFGLDVLNIEDNYHQQMADVLTPEHRELFLKSYQVYRSHLSTAILTNPTPVPTK